MTANAPTRSSRMMRSRASGVWPPKRPSQASRKPSRCSAPVIRTHAPSSSAAVTPRGNSKPRTWSAPASTPPSSNTDESEPADGSSQFRGGEWPSDQRRRDRQELKCRQEPSGQSHCARQERRGQRFAFLLEDKRHGSLLAENTARLDEPLRQLRLGPKVDMDIRGPQVARPGRLPAGPRPPERGRGGRPAASYRAGRAIRNSGTRAHELCRLRRETMNRRPTRAIR